MGLCSLEVARLVAKSSYNDQKVWWKYLCGGKTHGAVRARSSAERLPCASRKHHDHADSENMVLTSEARTCATMSRRTTIADIIMTKSNDCSTYMYG